MRGVEIFKEITSSNVLSEKSRKGRNLLLIVQRNDLLIDRYLYYALTSGKRYDVIVKHLSEEFFLSPYTIVQLIEGSYKEITIRKKEFQNIKEINKLKKKLREKWPHVVWD